MMDLSNVSVAAGVVVGLLSAPLLVAPAVARRWLAGFPRNRWIGWALTAVCLVWAAWLLAQTPLGRFDAWKGSLPVVTPLAFLLIICFVDDLLAARALGGLLVLVPAPLLDVARWHVSPLRLVMVLFAYGLAIAGIVLLLSPYWFRKAVQPLTARDRSCRIAGGAGVALGLLFAWLGIAAY